ncbi:MAG: hypothetical protein KDJ38_01285 [Gammaproteobacteria bacterium]|nr:hypothetical protein [Gammaproteobacteria bacterium]
MFASCYKEWLKIRWIWSATLLLNLAVLAYLFIDMRHQFRLEHSEMIWYWSFELRRLLYSVVKYLPLLSGILLAAAQFIPEMLGGRFRLSLHLPVRSDWLIWSWVGFGALAGAVLALLNLAGLYLIMANWFPHEAARSAVLTALPWLLAGWVAYFGTALVLLEPVALRRLLYLLISVGYVGLLYQETGYQEYDRVMLVFSFSALLFIPALALPVYRYRYRS